MILETQRSEVVAFSNLMLERGLTRGTGGNISIVSRAESLVAITPSAVEYTCMKLEDVAVVTLDGKQVNGNYMPSSEIDMHLECYRKRPDVGAVVHTHSLYATSLSCMQQPLPPVHYLIGYAGSEVGCIPYYLFGTPQLAEAAVKEMGNSNAVLLGNHGLLAVGKDIGHAFSVAEEIEFVSHIYCTVRSMGEPNLLDEGQTAQVLERFESYRQAEAAQAPREVI